MMDTSFDMINTCKASEQGLHNTDIEMSYIVGDEEYLPVKEWCSLLAILNELLPTCHVLLRLSVNLSFFTCSSLDLVISSLGLHWTNDLPGAMIQVCPMTLSSYQFLE